jgi:uncharacterized protein YkwD
VPHVLHTTPLVPLIILAAACQESTTEPLLEAGTLDPEVEAFVTLMNDHRVSVGCSRLAWHVGVADVAQAHSDDMVERDFFSHTNPDGDTPFDRLSNAGISYTLAAENIAWGYGSAEAVLEGWLGSSGHRANIENCALTEHGVGLSGTHWTHLFRTP